MRSIDVVVELQPRQRRAGGARGPRRGPCSIERISRWRAIPYSQRERLAAVGPEAARAQQRRRERLGGEVGGELGVARCGA